MAFANHIETIPDIKIALQYILLSSGLWSNSPRKTTIATILYFPAEEESVHIRKKQISVNSSGHDLDAIFL